MDKIWHLWTHLQLINIFHITSHLKTNLLFVMKTVRYHLVLCSLTYIVLHNMTPPPTWPPPRQRKLIIKGENPNKSANIDNRSYMKEPFVSSVSCRYTGATVQGFSWGLRLLVIGWHDVTNYSNYVFSQSCFFHLFFLTNYDFLRFQKSSFKLTNVSKLNYHTHVFQNKLPWWSNRLSFIGIYRPTTDIFSLVRQSSL